MKTVTQAPAAKNEIKNLHGVALYNQSNVQKKGTIRNIDTIAKLKSHIANTVIKRLWRDIFLLGLTIMTKRFPKTPKVDANITNDAYTILDMARLGSS